METHIIQTHIPDDAVDAQIANCMGSTYFPGMVSPSDYKGIGYVSYEVVYLKRDAIEQDIADMTEEFGGCDSHFEGNLYVYEWSDGGNTEIYIKRVSPTPDGWYMVEGGWVAK